MPSQRLATRPVRAALVAVFALALLALASHGLFAYTLNSYGAAWPLGFAGTPVLTIVVDDRGHPDVADPDGGLTSTIDAINSSTKSWNSTPMGLMVEAVAGDAVTDFAYNDGTPMVRFDDPESKCTGNCLGIASTWYAGSNGNWRITDSDITFNEAKNWISLQDPRWGLCTWLSGSYHLLENIIVHEVGHALGLKHSSVSGATMVASTSSCKSNLIDIHADDSAGLRDLYTGNPSCVALGARCGSHADCCRGGCVWGTCTVR